MSLPWDPSALCRDDRCQIVGLHRPHLIRIIKPEPHHRPSTSPQLPWKRQDPRGLVGAVMRATSKAYPVAFSSIMREVFDDYGSVTRRTIYRHVKALVERGRLVRYELGGLAAYVRPRSRLFSDREAVREYMLANTDIAADAIPWGRAGARL